MRSACAAAAQRRHSGGTAAAEFADYWHKKLNMNINSYNAGPGAPDMQSKKKASNYCVLVLLLGTAVRAVTVGWSVSR